MKLRSRRTAALIAAPAVFLATLVAVGAGSAAHAETTTPPWKPDANALGTVALYNSAGQVVTSGADFAHLADYAVASTAPNVTGATKATLWFSTPQIGVAPATWNTTQTSASTVFPNASAPAPVKTTANPVVTLTSADASLADHIGSYTNTDTTNAGYTDVYELRVTAVKPGQAWDGNYWATDIKVNTAAGTWEVVYPGTVTPPVGTAPVRVSGATVVGTPRVGLTVSCAAAFTGATSVTYSWKRNGVTIGGQSKNKLVLGAADYNRTVACVAKATNTFGSLTLTSPARKVAIGAALKVTTKPKLSGTFKVKKKVKVSKGSWSPSATSYSYQWKRNGKSIKGATKATYKLTKKDAKKKVTVVVTAKKAGYANGVSSPAAKKVKKVKK